MSTILDGLALVGLGLVVSGCWQAYKPLGLIIGGVLLTTVCMVVERYRIKVKPNE